ncbi:hypothetical protein BC834DRAFT_881001 [Gloeopeniophorella convolvens]|nr:hypothetical protein BC834DRAFT_881001 [Gloeopeniophorella convolvens]
MRRMDTVSRLGVASKSPYFHQGKVECGGNEITLVVVDDRGGFCRPPGKNGPRSPLVWLAKKSGRPPLRLTMC